MTPRFIATGSAKNSARESIDLPVGRYAALLLILKGTSDTGKTLALEDIGRIRIQRGGREIQNEDWLFYGLYSDLKTGWPNLTLPSAGATRVAIVIPFSASGLPNALDVMSKEEVDLFLDFDAQLDTEFGANAATYEVYGIHAPTQQEVYELHVEQQDQAASAAGRLIEKLNGRNIAAVYLKDPGADVTSLSYTVDGKVIVNEIDTDTLLDWTNIRNRKEAVGNTLIEINLVTTGKMQEIANTQTDIDTTFSGAGTLEVTKFRVEPSQRAPQSAEAVKAILASKSADVSRSLPRRPAGAVS